MDSHLHIEAPEAPSLIALASATETLLFACGVDRVSSRAAIGLSESNPSTVRAFVGVHPSEALKSRNLRWLGEALQKASGLGEVGLDPKYSGVGPRSAQMAAFLSQLETARSSCKPVQVHSRNAESACLDALGGFALKAVLMHWLQQEEALRRAMEKGYFVSFGPALLYSRKLQRMASHSNQIQVVVETDAPVPFAPLGGVHGPSLVPSVVFKLAEIWGMNFEDARDLLAANANRYLTASGKG